MAKGSFRAMIATIQRRVYRHARRAYHAVANRSYAERQRDLVKLLGEFVRPGALAFDIGANRGDYTDVLLMLGARVIAVEPNPDLARALASRYPVVVEQVAVGSAPGVLPLHLGNDSEHSTLSQEWLVRAPTPGRWSGDTVNVEVVTLARLIERHGRPDFVKIDVEGYEAEVLRSCAEMPRALSFEYQCSDIDVAKDCLALIDGFEFNIVDSGASIFREGWCDQLEILARLTARCDFSGVAYGDVYARRRDAPP